MLYSPRSKLFIKTTSYQASDLTDLHLQFVAKFSKSDTAGCCWMSIVSQNQPNQTFFEESADFMRQ